MEEKRQIIVKELLDLSIKLGRTPKWIEYNGTNRVRKYFGSWNEALKAAGLPVNRKPSNEQLINQIKEYCQKYGVPTSLDVRKKSEFPNYNLVLSRFGSLGNAITLAGFKTVSYRRGKKTYNQSEERILTILKEKIDSGQIKNKNDFNSIEELPSIRYIVKKLRMPLKEIIHSLEREDLCLLYKYNRETLKETYRRLQSKEDKYISTKEFERISKISINTVSRYFGSWNKFLEELEIETQEVRVVTETKEELLQMYIDFSKEIGKGVEGATTTDLDERFKYSALVLKQRFGGMEELRKLTGFKATSFKTKYTKEIIIDLLKKEMKKVGRRLSGTEINNNENLPAATTVARYFKTTKLTEVWKEIEKEF